MKITASRPWLRVSLVAAALGATISLTGCLQSTTALPATTGTAAPSSSSSPGAVPTPTPDSTTPKFVEHCDILLTAAQVYAYNPNFVADTTYSPKPGTIAAAIASKSGQTCGWVNETSGSLVEVAIATPLPTDLATAKTAASSGTAISSDGENGYFAVKRGVGSAQFFFGSFWLTVSSPDFATVSDAKAIYPIVIQNQLAAGG